LKQFDLFAARAAKEKALTQVGDAADSAWSAQAWATLRAVAALGVDFTSEDLWRAGLPKPREPRALGAVLATASRRGLILKTGRYLNTAMVSRHNAPVAIWRLGSAAAWP